LCQITNCMRFIVSDNIDLENGFGKWRYSHDGGVRMWTNGDRVCLYYGYTMSDDLDQLVQGDPDLIPEANGKFCVVMLWKDRMQVWIDYFCQSKVYYNTRDGLTVTNNFSSLAMSNKELDGEVIKKFTHGLYGKTQGDDQRLLKEWEEHTQDHTVVKSVVSMPRGHSLRHVDGKTDTIVIHNHRQDAMDALATPLDWVSAQLEDRVHQCMEQHSKIISKNYSNICSTVSDGIDSVLQNMYFKRASRLMYHPGRPNDSLQWKKQIITQLEDRGVSVRFDLMPEHRVDELTKLHTTDVNLSWMDLIPTLWQVNECLPQRPDMILYGQGADEMFMHRTGFLWAMVPPAQRPNYRDTYGGGESQPSSLFVESGKDHTWSDSIATQSKICLYNRDVENQTGIQTTSLYSDRRIFNLPRRMPRDVMLDSMANAGPQCRLLRDRFDFQFQTPHKDAAGYRCREVLKRLLTSTMRMVHE